MSGPVDLTDCDREPIQAPGAIQPHGVMLVAGRTSQEITHLAGDAARALGEGKWLGRTLGEALGDDLGAQIARLTQSTASGSYVGQLAAASGGAFDVSVHLVGEHLVVEIEPGVAHMRPASQVLAELEAGAAAFERTIGLKGLCDRAAVEFRRLTGFDRVMIYRFQDDDAGAVLAEDKVAELPSFLNHHFPGSDIPAQARALYVRNLVRVIPDIAYRPAPLHPAWVEEAPLDMSDCALRSVSPIHMQYMANMGVRASASVSIVKDGALWGLIACHNATPLLLPYEVRAACSALAGALARQIKAKEEAEGYRDRLRLRSFEDDIVAGLVRDGSLDANMGEVVGEVRNMMAADGVAVLRAGELTFEGVHPSEVEVRELASWALEQGIQPLATDRLSERFAPAKAYRDHASGLLALTISAEEPFLILWFRAEQVEVVEWAGNPHKAAAGEPGGALSPRKSFEAWSQTVRGRSRGWTAIEVEAAQRLRQTLLDARQARRLRELNQRLSDTLADKDGLLQQKEFLLKEVNHRVQNSLQLVSSFLGLQARALKDPLVQEPFEEARRRLSAVALVHRRLYRADQIETVDLSRYFEDLISDMLTSMGPEWAGMISLEISPVMIPTDRAVTLGLIVTELVINANKYAYDGAPGPIEIALSDEGANFRLVISDRGKGKHTPREGFGTRMMAAMVSQLSGVIEQQDNKPGLRAVLTAPVAFPASGGGAAG